MASHQAIEPFDYLEEAVQGDVDWRGNCSSVASFAEKVVHVIQVHEGMSLLQLIIASLGTIRKSQAKRSGDCKGPI